MMKTYNVIYQRMLILALSALLISCELIGGDGDDNPIDTAEEVQQALLDAKEGDVIEITSGTISFERRLTMDAKSGVRVKGKGRDQTVFSFENQTDGGDGWLITNSENIVIQDLTIRDPVGDALKITNSNGVVLYNIAAVWSGEPSPENGSYGLYPVTSSNILIENCYVFGASDAGIYVGQSDNAVVRNSVAEGNVAGIEIENTTNADVHDNLVTDNSAGILVFDLPNLSQPGGATRIFDNQIISNLRGNFAPGGIVREVPAGTGILVMSTKEVEIFDNNLEENNVMGTTVGSYAALVALEIFPEIQDHGYNPFPDKVYIHDNSYSRSDTYPDAAEQSSFGNLLVSSFGDNPIPDVILDGIFNPQGDASGSICIEDNGTHGFVNLNLPNDFPNNLSFNPAPHACSMDPLPEVVLTIQAFEDAAMRRAMIQKLGVSHRLSAVIGILSVLFLAGCSTKSGDGCQNDLVTPCIYTDEPHDRLSEYNLFEGELRNLDPIERLLPYDLNTPLFSDYAEKFRLIYMPPGEAVSYNDEEVLDFPVGSVLIKNFFYLRDETNPADGRHLLETRLLVREPVGWNAETYVWNDEQSEAYRKQIGDLQQVAWTDAEGRRRTVNYLIPGKNDCKTCHSSNGKLEPLGPKVRNLNRDYSYPDGPDNQLGRWESHGILQGKPSEMAAIPRVPVWDHPATGTIVERARTYLDVNCDNCHHPAGSARNAGLFLNLEQEDPFRLGVCKPPIAAGAGSGGHRYGIVPCKPDESILVYRMTSVEPQIRMPELGRTLVHVEAVALIKAWIESMECKSC